MKKTIEQKTAEENFYLKDFYFSYSSLNKLLYSPGIFYRHYVLGKKEDVETIATLMGKLTHCLLLDPDNFKNQFILLPGTQPSDNPKKVIEQVFQHQLNLTTVGEFEEPAKNQLTDHKDTIIDILKEVNLYQSLKTDEQRIDKIITDSHQEYFEFLFNRQDKSIVDLPTHSACVDIVEQLKESDNVMTLLGKINLGENSQVFNEFGIQIEKEGSRSCGLKGILDNLVIDSTNKSIKINDLKTTSKTISEFRETVDFFKLWIQAALYKKLVMETFLLANNLNPDEWDIKFTFIVIDKYKQNYCFEVSKETMKAWEENLEKELEKADWHYSNNRFDLPYELAITDVLL